MSTIYKKSQYEYEIKFEKTSTANKHSSFHLTATQKLIFIDLFGRTKKMSLDLFSITRSLSHDRPSLRAEHSVCREILLTKVQFLPNSSKKETK